MKISIINTLYAPFKVGGAEVSVQALAEGLVERGHEVQVICLRDGEKEMRTTINGVSVVYLPLANIYWPYDGKDRGLLKKVIWNLVDTYNIVMAGRVKTLVDQFSPDVVHTNNLKGFSVAVWRWISESKVRVVHTSRDYYLFHPNSTLFSNGSNQSVRKTSVLLGSWIKKKESKFVNAYIGISNYITNLHIENGFFCYSESNTIFNVVTHDVPPKIIEYKIVVGFMGHLSVSKGFDSFIEMARKFDSPAIKFIAAGNRATDSKSLDLYKNAIDSKIDLLGFVSPSHFLSKVDVVVMPVKWNEPFGRVAVEAALAGKLVFINPRGGLKELSEIVPNIQILDENTFLDDIKNGYPVKKSFIPWHSNFSVRKVVSAYCSVYSGE